MKRLIAVLTLCCVVAFACGTTALAEKPVTLTAAGPATCAPGSTITVEFAISANSNMCAADFYVGFDTGDFKVVDDIETPNKLEGQTNTQLLDGFLAFANDNDDGQFHMSVAGTEPLTDGGVLFTLEFMVDSAAAGQHKFYFFAQPIQNFDNQKLETTFAEYTVEIAGKPVSSVTIDPVIVDKQEVSAQNQDDKIVESNNTNQNEPELGIEAIVVISVLAVGLIGAILLVVSGMLRNRKSKEKQEPEYKPVLDKEATDLLDLGNNKKSKKKDSQE